MRKIKHLNEKLIYKTNEKEGDHTVMHEFLIDNQPYKYCFHYINFEFASTSLYDKNSRLIRDNSLHEQLNKFFKNKYKF